MRHYFIGLMNVFGLGPLIGLFKMRPFIYLWLNRKQMDMNTPEKQIHQGRNVKRFREMLGLKQEALAYELGEDWSQKKVSLMEANETIDHDILAQVAQILKVPVEAIKNFDEEKAVNIISNNFSDFKDDSIGINYNHQPTFNPIDKLIEVYEENKQLYERLLASEREKVELLKNR